MQIGMIGLGKMGGNMSRRLMKAGHGCVVFARSAASREALVAITRAGADPSSRAFLENSVTAAAVAVAALLLQIEPVPEPPAPASVASSLTVTEVGTTPVRVLEVRLATTPRLTV